MGLLTSGTALTWSETKKHARYIQTEGIKQFVYLHRTLNSRMKHTLKWGDEIEYTLVRLNPVTRDVQLFLGASELLQKLPPVDAKGNQFIWQPEYADYMVEGLPGIPFGQLPHAFSTVEPNMCKRRKQLESCLPKDCFALTLTTFPRLGCPDFCYPPAPPTPRDGVSKSLFFPDRAINQGHPRFKTLTRNIRERRGAKVAINVPIYRDTLTPNPFVENLDAFHDGSDPDATSAALPDHVYLDAMGFGMGCSCLQITFQSCCIEEARILYDQLATICPILMALSAASPAIRGYLLDTDCRWSIISASVDDRTEEERGLKPLVNNRFVIPKSRYDSISSYLSPMGEAYNDIELVYDPEFYQTLVDEGVDEPLAKHVAHLFIRDPVSVFSERLIVPEDEEFVDHFENIQSTNWQSMRFKPPPLNSSIGWRVEFRPLELQLTDFENAAFVTFVLLISRTILRLKLNLLIPISKVDENMRTAVKRDAVLQEQFYFRRGYLLSTDGSPTELTSACSKFRRTRSYSIIQNHTEQQNISDDSTQAVNFCKLPDAHRPVSDNSEVNPEDTYTLMPISEIMNGSPTFPGLIPLVRHYVHVIGGDPAVVCLVHRYLDFLERRASGDLMTTAAWMRSRIRAHPDYRFDSRVSRTINTDLMQECCAITRGELRPPELLPSLNECIVSTDKPCYLRFSCRQCCVDHSPVKSTDSSANTITAIVPGTNDGRYC
ncbi:Glutamate--cysteine ligase catalytic subunit [Paragonimus heterotremus]|uniref:Glutamate--cysteine ligase n=1 Tax=Paragonimus heterotremus TaxID=100268 RepID=A0A8J4TMH0_9TREM|nr:Glutamate--cysteine ligase catalytic subunit [Paragonimus heterotremus]